LHELLNADAAQLSTVPGVGPSRAAALEQLLHAALPTSHNALTSKILARNIEEEPQNPSSS
jgi:DNA repair protein RadC